MRANLLHDLRSIRKPSKVQWFLFYLVPETVNGSPLNAGWRGGQFGNMRSLKTYSLSFYLEFKF